MKRKSEIDFLLLASKQGLKAYKAKVYIDCTGDGDLAAWAGATYEVGDQEHRMQSATHCFSMAGVDMYHYTTGIRLHGDNKKVRFMRYWLIKNIL
ncbi:FAD-dependent oxidoreductase [Bacteroides salyersiae]|nr:FAD-dependent oxidoreductase [Bacteroides salyersiae]